jgi:hypothetical protein
MSQARIGGKHFEVLARTGEDDFGMREGLFGGGEEHAGDRDIRAEGDAGQDDDPRRFERHAARLANALIPHEVCPRNHWREQARVDIAEGRLEAIAEALDQNSKEGLGAGLFEELSWKFRGRIAGDTPGKHFARDLVTRSTSQ